MQRRLVARRSLLAAAGAGAAGLLLPDVGAAAVYPTPRRTSVCFVPHPDDDVLAFGAYIASQVAAGNRVYVVLYTDGSSSVVCGASGARCTAGAWSGRTVADFSAARKLELRRAVRALGVPDEQIVTDAPDLARDSLTTTAYVRTVMQRWTAKVPGATYVAQSWIDAHVDHRNGGLALRSLVDDRIVAPDQAAFALSRWYWQYGYPGRPAHDYQAAQDLRALLGRPAAAHLFTTPALRARLQDAADCYYPAYGTGIGYTSVPLYLDTFRHDPTSLLHGYARERYSTRITLQRGTGSHVTGALRTVDYPGDNGSEPGRDPLGLVQALHAANVADPARGETVTVTGYAASGRALASTPLAVGVGGAYGGTVSLPRGTATLRARYSGSTGLGPATSSSIPIST